MPAISRRSPFASASYRALLGAQFLGAYNDNLFKMLVSLMAVDAAAGAALGSGGYLSLTGIIFIVPYLLFSGYAGHVADRFGKRSVLVTIKALEVAVMGLALAAFMVGDVVALLAVLFLMATQSTFFSPAKFGVLPEMLPAGQLAQANGYLEMARYVAVILGSVSAGGLLVVFPDDPLALGGILLAVACLGAAICLRVEATKARRSSARFSANPFASIGAGLKRIAADRSLRNAVAGITYVEALAAFVMMDILLVGKEVMGLDDLGAGMLLSIAGIGIGVGAALAARLSVGRINLGLAGPASAGIALALILLSLGTHSFTLTAAAIGLVGVFGGIYMVPLNAELQHRAGKTEKGVTICASNFVNMTGALVACGVLWVGHDLLGISPVGLIVAAGAIATVASVLQFGHGRRFVAAIRIGPAGHRLGTASVD